MLIEPPIRWWGGLLFWAAWNCTTCPRAVVNRTTGYSCVSSTVGTAGPVRCERESQVIATTGSEQAAPWEAGQGLEPPTR